MTVATLHLHEGFLLEKFVFLFVPYVEIEVVQPITKFQVRQCRLPCRTQRNKKKRSISFSFHAPSCPDAVTQAFVRTQANKSELKTIKQIARFSNPNRNKVCHGVLGHMVSSSTTVSPLCSSAS